MRKMLALYCGVAWLVCGVVCGQDKPNYGLRGKITIDGSSTVYPISESAAARFKKMFPNVDITVGKSGTGGGFKRFVEGETDISNASRPIKKSEFEQCRENGVTFIELPISYDGLTFVVHPSNSFVNELTIDQLKRIFLDDTAAKTWREIDRSWPDQPIRIFAPGTDSGTFDYFKEVVAGSEGSIRGDMSTSEDDSVLVNGVAGDKWSLGFFGVAYYFQNQDKLKALKIVNPGTGSAVMPSETSIEDGSYAPFSRPLFIYLNNASINKAHVERFVEFYLDSAAEMARQVGYVALPEAIYEKAMDNFLDEKVGTHYLMPGTLEPRTGSIVEVFSSGKLVK